MAVKINVKKAVDKTLNIPLSEKRRFLREKENFESLMSGGTLRMDVFTGEVRDVTVHSVDVFSGKHYKR